MKPRSKRDRRLHSQPKKQPSGAGRKPRYTIKTVSILEDRLTQDVIILEQSWRENRQAAKHYERALRLYHSLLIGDMALFKRLFLEYFPELAVTLIGGAFGFILPNQQAQPAPLVPTTANHVPLAGSSAPPNTPRPAPLKQVDKQQDDLLETALNSFDF